MEEEITKLKPLLRSLAEEAQAQAGEHLAVEQLAAYHFKKLPDDEAERTLNHLVMCRECTSLLLDFAEFCAPGEEGSIQPARAEVKIAEIESQPAPSIFQRFRELIFPFRFVYALAAMSLVLSVSLAFWAAS